VGIGGSYFDHEHTAMSFRDEFYLSDILERMPWGVWNQQEFKGIEDKARAKVIKIMKEHRASPLKPEIEAEIDRIVLRAKKCKGLIQGCHHVLFCEQKQATRRKNQQMSSSLMKEWS